jgi:hypothetical protein
VIGLAVLLGLCCAAAPARAEYVKGNWTHASPYLTLNVTYDPAGAAGPYNYDGVLTGRYHWSKTEGDATWLGSSFWTYCIEITQQIDNPVNFTVKEVEKTPDPAYAPGGMGLDKANRLREYWGRNFSSNFTSVQAAAFQLGIWEIVFDGSGTSDPTKYDAGAGEFYVRNAGTPGTNAYNARVLANTWLRGLTGDTKYYEYGLVSLSSPYDQDQIAVRPTPAPSGLLAGLLGLGGMAGYLWRRRKAA